MTRILVLLAALFAMTLTFELGVEVQRAQFEHDILNAEIFTVGEPEELGAVYLGIGDEIFVYDLYEY